MSKIRFRQKKLVLSAIFGALGMLLICIIIGYFVIDNMQHKHRDQTAFIKQELKTTQEVINIERIQVPVLSKDISSGNMIKTEDVQYVSLPKNAAPADLSDKTSLIGRFVKLDLKKNTVILDSMLYEEEKYTDDIRNQEFRLIELPSKLQTNDFVDVRVKFPTGQDYIVLSKKRVEDLVNNTVWYTMNEEEILKMSSAIVDAYINDATIYALTYVDPGIQNKAYVTYPANQMVLDLINADPNIVNVATTELEKRNREKLEQDLNSLPEELKQKYRNNVSNNKPLEGTNDTTNTTSSSDISTNYTYEVDSTISEPSSSNPLLENESY